MADRRQPPPADSSLPRRPMLRPGVRVCPRDDGMVQVGLNAHHAVRVPDTSEIRSVLSGMQHGTELPRLNSLQPATARACIDLWGRRLLMDANDLLTVMAEAPDEAARQQMGAFFVRGGTATRWRERAKARVEVRHRHLPAAAELLATLLTTAGVTVTEPDAGDSDLVVLLSNGVADRAECDILVRHDRPHVLLTTVEGRVELGPFVEPGTSTCVRCIDAHRTERDPRLALVIAHYLGTPPTVAPDPVPHDLVTVAVGALSHDVVRWIDGEEPATWSATLHVAPTLTLDRQPWRRHPSCGCNWDELYAV